MSEQQNNSLSLDWLICHLRWAWLAIAVIIILLHPQLAGQNLLVAYLLPAVGVVYNLLVLALLFIGWYPNWLAWTTLVLDVIVSIGLMWITGGHESNMLPVLLFPVITSVLRLNTETGLLLSALPATLAYVASIITALVLTQDVEQPAIVKSVADLAVLFGAGVLAGSITHRQLHLKTTGDRTEIKRLRIESDPAKVIYEMANTLSSTLNYRKVLNAMVDLAQLALSEAGGSPQDASVVGMVLLFEEDAPLGKLELAAGRNIPRIDEGTKVLAQEGLLAQAVYKAEAITGSHINRDPVLKNFMALQNCDSVVCAPLRAGFDVYGLVLFASPEKNIYTQEHASLLTTFCNQAIIALQNAQLYEDLEKEQKKLLEKEAQARRELARNLHDGPTQAVAAMAMRLNFVQLLIKREGNIEKALDELAKIEQISLRTTKEIRTMLFTLRPVVLETQGLAAAIEQYADRLRDLDNLNIELALDEYDGQLTTEAEAVIFAIIEEAIGNAKKHANAKVIRIHVSTQRVSGQDGFVVAEVSDNGKGFEVAAVKSTYDQRGSLGLLNMEERAQMVGGRCNIISAEGKGTRVKVEVPISRNR
ncbi:MAG: GAF domain-containing sensor histidine kinase [Anaerolineae bacterium]